MSVTRVRDLLGLAVVFGVLGYLAVRRWYLDLPPLPWVPGVTLLIIAAFEFVLAARLRAVIGHDPDARPMPAVVVARWIAVGRASAVAGAVLAGLGAGLSVHVLTVLGDLQAAPADLTAGLLFTVGAAVLTVCGCLLERAGLVPPDGPRPTR